MKAENRLSSRSNKPTHERLTVNFDRILQEFEQLARKKIYPARDKARLELIDNLPRFLRRLVKRLQDQPNYPTNYQPDTVIQQIAEFHGHYRASVSNFNLQDVILEYQLLRRVLFTVLREEGPILDQEYGTISADIDTGILYSTQLYLETSRIKTEFQERLFRSTFEQAAVGIAHVALDGKWIRVNQKLCEIVGYTREELLKLSFQDITCPDDLNADLNLAKRLYDREIENYQLEKRYICKDGRIIWANLTVSLVTKPDSTPLYFIAVIEDVSPRKKAEENLKSALKDVQNFKFALDISSIVAVTDNRGIITFVNDKFCEISKFSRGELIGKTHRVINSGYHSKQYFIDLWKTISRGQVWKGEIKNRAKDGSYYWVDTVIVPLIDSNGIPYQYTSIRHDITNQKRAQDELKESLEKLQEEQELRERFVSALTHDLRTPLTSAKMSAQMLRRSHAHDEGLQKSAERIINGLDRTDKMIQDLLDANRISAGEALPIRTDPCDLSAIVSGTLEDLKQIYGDRFQHIGICPKVTLYWDCNGLKRVLENLCSNAVKYGDPNSIISIMTRIEENSTLLSVHNEGPPLSLEEQRNLFQLFKRSQSALQSGKKGWGIGLTLVRGLVEAHGGQISVKSTQEEGTTFTVRLPMQARSQILNL